MYTDFWQLHTKLLMFSWISETPCQKKSNNVKKEDKVEEMGKKDTLAFLQSAFWFYYQTGVTRKE